VARPLSSLIGGRSGARDQSVEPVPRLGLLLAQSFAIRDDDILYVSDALGVDLQKFLAPLVERRLFDHRHQWFVQEMKTWRGPSARSGKH
jgi:hypothetical protein